MLTKLLECERTKNLFEFTEFYTALCRHPLPLSQTEEPMAGTLHFLFYLLKSL
jgi:hypothetical protein